MLLFTQMSVYQTKRNLFTLKNTKFKVKKKNFERNEKHSFHYTRLKAQGFKVFLVTKDALCCPRNIYVL